MFVNEKTAIVGQDIVLVPYRYEHVERYHEWMLSPELRELTASEPLTLEEEYQMQRNWQQDADKLTFIILVRPYLLERPSNSSDPGVHDLPTKEQISTLTMVGDVNLFVKGSPEEGIDEVEAEVMIAEPAYRKKGVAFSALNLMFGYATSPDGPEVLRIKPEKLVARIGEDNMGSIRLFEKLGFQITKRVAIFHEVEMRHRGDAKWVSGTAIEY